MHFLITKCKCISTGIDLLYFLSTSLASLQPHRTVSGSTPPYPELTPPTTDSCKKNKQPCASVLISRILLKTLTIVCGPSCLACAKILINRSSSHNCPLFPSVMKFRLRSTDNDKAPLAIMAAYSFATLTIRLNRTLLPLGVLWDSCIVRSNPPTSVSPHSRKKSHRQYWYVTLKEWLV